MSNRFSSIIKKKLAGKNRNLASFDEPYDVISNLMKAQKVSTVIDAGASNGHVSRRFLQRFPSAHVYAFEPNPMYQQQLLLFAQNDLRFKPQFVALSDHESDEKLFVTDSPGNTSLLSPDKRLIDIDPSGSVIETSQPVHVTTIDNWVKANNVASIEIMKFDIQGGELKALQGASDTLKNSTLLVYAEIWFNPGYQGGALYSEIDLFLRQYEFGLYDIYKPRYDKNGLIMWANAIFLNLDKLGI